MKKMLLMLLIMGALLVGCSKDTEPSRVPAPNPETGTEAGSQTNSETGAEAGSETKEEETKEPYVVSFEANTIEGQPFSSGQFSESKVTMINVWATYCNPCLMEMPDLEDIAEEYDKADFQLIGIISDVMEDSPSADLDNAKELIRETEAEYPHLLLNQSIYDNLVSGVTSVPTTFFVNAKGEMLGYVIGANDEDTWEKIIDELLAKEGVIDD